MADGLGAHHVPLLLAVEPNALLLGELTLLDLQLVRHGQEPLLDPLLGHGLLQEREMVPEEEDAPGIVDLGVGPQLLLEEDGPHGGHVFV